MACQIIYRDNNTVEVRAENGNISQLYTAISNNPLLSQEQSLEAYKNIFSTKFTAGQNMPLKTDENGEPILYFKSGNGLIYATYKEALDNTQEGNVEGVVIITDDITYSANSYSAVNINNGQVTVNEVKALETLFQISSNSNPETLDGFINQQIRLGQLNDTRLNDRLFGTLNSELVRQDVAGAINIEATTFADGSIELTYNNPEILFEDITKSEFITALKEGREEDMVRRMGAQNVANHAFDIYHEKNSLFRDGKKAEPAPTTFSEQQLQNSLKSFLSRIGVNVTSIEDYIVRYKTKNGVEPTAEALADIANKVVAFAQGQETVENMTEETAHFAIEAYQDQETLNRMLENVHLSNEWAEDSQRYLDVYSKDYQGAELDNIIRKEILGKILARKLREQFTDTQNTPVEAGFTNLLRTLWNTLIERIRSIITPSVGTELDNFTDAIANNILNDEFDDIFTDKDLSKSNFIFYSLSDKQVLTRLKNYLNSLQKVNNQLKGARTGNLDTQLKNAANLLTNTEELNNAESWMAIQQLNAALSTPIRRMNNIVQEALKKSNNGDPNQNKLYLDGVDIATIAQLSETKGALQQVIAVVENNLLTEVEQVNRDTTLQELKDKLEQINKLERDSSLLSTAGAETVWNKISAQLGIPELAERVKSKIRGEIKDITKYTQYLGQAANADNDQINGISYIASANNSRSSQDTQRAVNPFLTQIESLGFNQSKINNIIEKDAKGNATGYIISDREIGKFIQDLQKESVRLTKEILNLPEETSDKEVLRRVSSFDDTQQKTYDNGLTKWRRENEEQLYTPEVYEKLEAEREFMSQETKDLIRGWQQQRAFIKRKYPNAGDLMSTEDRITLEQIALDRKAAKSLVDQDGNRKYSGTSEYQIAQDLIEADNKFRDTQEGKITTLKAKFLERLVAIEQQHGNKAAVEWLTYNGGHRFNSDFYDALGTRSEDNSAPKSPKIVQTLRNAKIDEEDQERVEDLADSLENNLNLRTDILRRHQKSGNPSEVDVSAMNEASKAKVRELDILIQKYISEANTILRRNGVEQVQDPQTISENTVNQSYYDDLITSGLKPSEIGTNVEGDFIYTNISVDNQVELTKFVNKLESLTGGSSDNIEPKYRRFFAKYFNLDASLSEDEFADEVIANLRDADIGAIAVEYGRTKLPSYYKRFAPQGYSEFFTAFQNGEIAPSRLLNDRDNLIQEYAGTQYVEITPNYTWVENTTENEINPNYDPNWEGRYQPKKDRYTNAEYARRYVFNSEGQPTQNIEEFQLLETMRDLSRQAAILNKVNADINKLPQFSKKTMEKFANILNIGVGETLRREYLDTFLSRVDEADYGQVDNQSQHTVPIIGMFDLEERTDVSTNIALTYAELYKQASLRYYRMETLRDVMALRQEIAEAKFTNGKTGIDSNAYKMADEYIEANFYGIKQQKKLEVKIGNFNVDLSRLASVFRRFLNYGALAFNPVVVLTNYVTGALQLNVTETLIGENISPTSNLFATQEFNLRQLPLLISETGKLNKTSKVYKLLDSSGALELSTRLANRNLGAVANLFTNLGYSGYLAGDIALKSKVFIAILDDQRLVGDTFMTYNNYKLRPENAAKTKTEIATAWDAYRENSLWNSLEGEGTETLKPKQSLIDRFGEQRMQEIITNTLIRASNIASDIDGQTTETEKVAANRHYAMQFILPMRGWLFNLISRRFQNSKTNLLKQQTVEGTYITAGKYVSNIVGKMIDDRGIRGLLSAVKSEWGNLDQAGKANMYRTLTDFSLFLVLLGLSALALAGEDDDDPYLYTFASYILLRVTSETGSLGTGLPFTGAGTPGAVMDVMDKPIMATTFLKELYKGGLFEPISSPSSKYEGVPKLFSLFIKNSPAKQLYDLSEFGSGDIKKTRDTYRQLNSGLYFLSKQETTEEYLEYFLPN